MLHGVIPGFHILKVESYQNAGCHFLHKIYKKQTKKKLYDTVHMSLQWFGYHQATWTYSNSIFPSCDCHVTLTNDNVIWNDQKWIC